MFEVEFSAMRNEKKLAKWLKSMWGVSAEAAEVMRCVVALQAGRREQHAHQTAFPGLDQCCPRTGPLGMFQPDVETFLAERGFGQKVARVFRLVLAIIDRGHFQPSAILVLGAEIRTVAKPPGIPIADSWWAGIATSPRVYPARLRKRFIKIRGRY
ncbi:hypothetical protein D3C84_777010 [compost metagenome]